MRQKNNKKLLSLTQYAAIDTWLKDLSLTEDKTESTIAEEILLGLRPGMLPPSPSARGNIIAWYADKDAVSQMYRSAFGYIAGFIGGNTYTPDIELCLVNSLFSHLLKTPCCICKCDKDTTVYYTNSMLELCQSLSNERNALTGIEGVQLEIELQHAKRIYHQLANEPQFTQCHHIINVIQHTWQYSRKYPATYRLLCSQTDMLPLPNTPSARLEVLQAIHKASAAWPY